MNDMFVFGASGHSKVVIDILEHMGGYRVLALVDDDDALWGKDFFSYPVIGGRQQLLDEVVLSAAFGIVAIGNNKARLLVANWLMKQGFVLCSAIHPSAQIGRNVHIGVGTVVMAGAVINSGTWIGDNVVINTGSTIDHDCTIENGAHVAPGCSICGNVSIGEASLVGVGSTIIPGITIGKNVVVGAGAVVIAPVFDCEVVVGMPAYAIAKK